MRLTYFADLYRQLMGFPRTIKLFYASDIFFGIGAGIFNTLFNLHLLAIGYTAEHVGRLASVSSLAMALFAIPIGFLGDRYGRRIMYVAGSVLFGVAYLLLPFPQHLSTITAVYILSILAQALIFVTETPLLAGEVGAERRSGLFSLMFINYFIWNTVGTQMAGVLPQWLPAGGLGPYQWPLLAAGISCLGSGILRAFVGFRPQPPAPSGLRLSPSRAVWAFGLFSLLAGVYSTLMFSFNNVILRQRFGFADASIGTIMAIGGILGWMATLFVPWLTGRFGSHRAAVGMTTLQGLVLFGLGAAAAPALYVPVLWLRAVTSTLNMSVGPTFQMTITPEAERATSNAVAMMGRNIGAAAAAPLFGYALASGRYGLAFAVAGVAGLAAALTLWISFRETEFD